MKRTIKRAGPVISRIELLTQLESTRQAEIGLAGKWIRSRREDIAQLQTVSLAIGSYSLWIEPSARALTLNLNVWNFHAEIQTAKALPVLLSNLSGCTIGHGPVWQNNLPPIFTLSPNGPCQMCFQLLEPFTVWHPLCSTSFTSSCSPASSLASFCHLTCL